MRKSIYLLFIFIVIQALPGCTKTKYLDSPTPAGTVPAPPALEQPRIQSLERTHEYGSGTSASGSGENQLELGDNMIRNRPLQGSGPGAGSGTISMFSSSYQQKDKPRIAVFLNRFLSDEVREWRSGRRVIVSGEGSVSQSRETASTFREETVSGPVAITEQQRLGLGGGRVNPRDEVLWPFEDGFMQPFLQAGATLIDRSTVMRLVALKDAEGKTNDYDPVPLKRVEMNALKNHADIFVELLISRVPSAPCGYEFKAAAKEVKTGRIIANATSLNWDKKRFEKKKVITTASGYEIKKETTFPKMNELSRDLAMDLMNSLIRTWGSASDMPPIRPLAAPPRDQGDGDIQTKQEGSSSRPPDATPSVSQRWALVIGLSQYKDSRIPTLRYADKDAKLFYDWLIASDGGRYSPLNVKLLLNETATLQNIREALYVWLKQPIEEDEIVIYFSGHGSPESVDVSDNLFLLPYDTDFDKISSTGFPMWDVKTAIQRFIKAKRMIIIADACHAGGVGSGFVEGRRALKQKPAFGNAFQNIANIGHGIAVLTASDNRQLSQEGRKWGGGHGVFTWFLLKGLEGEADYSQDGVVTLGELIPFVSEHVRRNTNNMQCPTIAGKFDPTISIAK